MVFSLPFIEYGEELFFIWILRMPENLIRNSKHILREGPWKKRRDLLHNGNKRLLSFSISILLLVNGKLKMFCSLSLICKRFIVQIDAFPRRAFDGVEKRNSIANCLVNTNVEQGQIFGSMMMVVLLLR